MLHINLRFSLQLLEITCHFFVAAEFFCHALHAQTSVKEESNAQYSSYVFPIWPSVKHVTSSDVFLWIIHGEHQYLTAMETIGSDVLLPDIQLEKEVSNRSAKV